MTVNELMTRDVKVCHPQDALAEAARLMWDHECGAVPVVDHDHRVVGVITDRDVAMAAYLEGRPLHQLVVASAMSKRVHVCHPEDSVFAAEQIMRDHQVRRLPVTDADRHVVGLLSLNDVARAGASEQARLPLTEVGGTLAAISRPYLPAERPAERPDVPLRIRPA